METHRWSGWFPLSEIWVDARSQISGPCSCDATPAVFWADLNLTQRFFFFVFFFLPSDSIVHNVRHLCLHVTLVELGVDGVQDLRHQDLRWWWWEEGKKASHSQENVPFAFLVNMTPHLQTSGSCKACLVFLVFGHPARPADSHKHNTIPQTKPLRCFLLA